MTNNTMTEEVPVIDVKDLKVYFPVRKGVLGKITDHVKAVDSVSFTINKGDIFALVGESGCGKTTTAHAVVGLQHITSGSVRLSLDNYSSKQVQWGLLDSSERRAIRKHIQVVFQDPFSSLDPRMTVGSILEEPMRIHNLYNGKERKERIVELLLQVGLSSEYFSRYPHEFSGGQRQRIGIARALATDPTCIVADEPVSALDVSIQAQIINLLQDLQKSRHLTQLFISHDLAVVRHIANKVAVMYLGKIIESGTEEQLFTNPLHPYTMLLLESIPIPGKGRLKKNISAAGDIDNKYSANGCTFYPRCPKRKGSCLDTTPILKDCDNSHYCTCQEC